MNEISLDDNTSNSATSVQGADEPATLPPRSPGATLAAAREAHSLSIEQVASHLNLAPRQVVALETDNYAALPGMVIARGFFRSYAKLLRIDPIPLLAIVAVQNQPASSAPVRHALSGSFSESRLPSAPVARPGRSGVLAPVIAAFAVVVVAGAVSYAMGWLPEALMRRVAQFRLDVLPTGTGAMVSGKTAQAVAALPGGGIGLLTTTQTLSDPAARLSADPGRRTPAPGVPVHGTELKSAAMTSIGPASGAALQVLNPLVLNFRQDSWVEIKRADNTFVVSKVIRAGSVETFDVSGPLTLTIGNIAGVDARLRGNPLQLGDAVSGNVAKMKLK